MFKAKELDPDKPPRTWTELLDAAKALRDPAKNVYGFGFSAVQAEEGVFQFLPFLNQAGGSIDKLNQPEATAALSFWADMVRGGLASRDVINQRQYEVTNTFMAGNTAMALCGPWELPRLQKDAKFAWKLTLLPVKADKNIEASALGGYDWVVPKGAKHGDGAFRFIEFMSAPKILNEGWKTGRLAPRSDITVVDPLWPQAYGIYRMQIESARARGPHPQWPDISRALQLAMQEAITGTKPANAALADAARKIAPILAKTPL
jgi:multiple sugar transport system substrate-binding protein